MSNKCKFVPALKDGFCQLRDKRKNLRQNIVLLSLTSLKTSKKIVLTTYTSKDVSPFQQRQYLIKKDTRNKGNYGNKNNVEELDRLESYRHSARNISKMTFAQQKQMQSKNLKLPNQP